jgi:hypothetical protein
MFEILMKPGSHRVDYLNMNVVGKPAAFAFYVCGEISPNAIYSASAKRALLAGLSVIQATLGPENLVAVYLDVNSLVNLARPAYNRMKEDLRAGMFRRLFVLPSQDVMGESKTANDLGRLYQEVGGFDLLTFDQGAFKPVMLMRTSALA